MAYLTTRAKCSGWLTWWSVAGGVPYPSNPATTEDLLYKSSAGVSHGPGATRGPAESTAAPSPRAPFSTELAGLESG
jgi:hypothetical protein